MKTESLQRLENSLTDVEFALAALGADAALKAGPDGRPQADSMPQLAPAEIALRDDGMARLMTELQTLRTEAQIQSSRLGHNHPQMQELRMQIVARQQQINDHAAAWNANQARAGGLSSGVAGLSVAELTMRQTRYREMISQTRRELSELGRVMLDVERLGREKDDILIRLEETRRRLDLLNFESPVQGRIQIASFGEQPVLDKDKRIPLAMVGGIGGVGTGVGLVLLFALLDRRMRSPDDASPDAGRLQLLGVLPTLPDDPSDPEEAAIAAHCVHHIRAMLQVTGGAHGHRTFGLTSPTAGAGKTSLTLAVGASFAAANIRTLMIDCDVLGQGLSGRVGRVAHRRLGQMLLRTGQITEIQLERALAAASQSGRHLGEALVELGHLPQDRITDALQAQARSTLGLLDALGGEALDDCVVETGIRGLFILPAGAASPEDVSQLSPESLRTLMDKARSRFDVVLVDTGPVLGSLEASVLATVVDGMVLVVSRGESRTLAERAVRHLRSIGTPISGMVFNRADTRDVRRSSATSRISSFASGISCAGQDREPASRAALGPLASAVHNRRTAIDEHKPL
jgi:Mrp family chromosome partitioning ATPase